MKASTLALLEAMTAETPALPIKGLILPCESLHISLPIRSPPIVANTNAIRPSRIIFIVDHVRNTSPNALLPTHTPRKIVTVFISPF